MENQISVKHVDELLRLRATQKASETATGGVIWIKVLLKISQNSQVPKTPVPEFLSPVPEYPGRLLLKLCISLFYFLKSTALLKKFTTENIKISINSQILI